MVDIMVPLDHLVAHMSVVTVHADPAIAMQKNAEKVTAILGFLDGLSIPREDVSSCALGLERSFVDIGGRYCHHGTMALGKRHCRTLCAVLEEPTRANIRWADFLALVKALGGEVSHSGKTAGSRQRIKLRGRRAVLHRPHPGSEITKGSVESARRLLRNAGVSPKEEGCVC